MNANVQGANGSSQADLIAQIAALKAENAALKVAKVSKLSFKVSAEKGALSVYGLGRFPVTLYRGQWERLIEAIPELKAFIVAHASQLTSKD